MHAYLIIGEDTKELDNQAKILSQKLKANLLEFSLAKVSDIRELSKFVSLSQTKPVAIYLKNIDKASLEALNALLKTLEEPQKNVKYILSASNPYAVIPTILSRCQLIKVGRKNVKDDSLAKEFLKMNKAQILLTLTQIKTAKEAIDYLQNLIYSLHMLLVKNKGKNLKIVQALKLAQKTLIAIEKNGNVTLQLTNFAINL